MSDCLLSQRMCCARLRRGLCAGGRQRAANDDAVVSSPQTHFSTSLARARFCVCSDEANSAEAQNETAELDKTTQWCHNLLQNRLASLLNASIDESGAPVIDFSCLELEIRIGVC